MTGNTLDAARIAIIKAYFAKIDRGDASYLDDVTDDVELFFPKFGTGRGKADLILFGKRLGRDLQSLAHDIDGFSYIVSGNTIVVEGRESGVTAAGIAWPDGEISQGRFCNVFDFQGLKMRRIAIYVDPDFASTHADRIHLLRGKVGPGDTTRAVVERYFELLSTGADARAVAALFSEAVDWVIAGDTARVSWIGRKVGRAGVASFVTQLREAIESVRFERKALLVDGHRAVAIGELVSRVKATGRLIETEFAFDFTVEEGLVTRFRMFEDSVAVAAAA
ncbi:nuclear transport factor 2 family protein [Phreatobacter sp. AB_2022a]|uniref:nuclear transport factor 2 family protein n=1 Tax=Phreatobacter sp. AB_2022a TaxID=3003134 RepID=UPI00228738AB|nr:nuclear transport factor 2 family protein [Phreatobacter sp. AB_2022a]MCZ0732870.1 nuclear transport factor 2 family protein [Phreatobacter sp. AB_2022a]